MTDVEFAWYAETNVLAIVVRTPEYLSPLSQAVRVNVSELQVALQSRVSASIHTIRFYNLRSTNMDVVGAMKPFTSDLRAVGFYNSTLSHAIVESLGSNVVTLYLERCTFDRGGTFLATTRFPNLRTIEFKEPVGLDERSGSKVLMDMVPLTLTPSLRSVVMHHGFAVFRPRTRNDLVRAFALRPEVELENRASQVIPLQRAGLLTFAGQTRALLGTPRVDDVDSDWRRFILDRDGDHAIWNRVASFLMITRPPP